MGERFSEPVHAGLGAHTAFYTIGAGSFPGCRGVALTTRPHQAPRLREEESYTFTPPLVLRGAF